MSKLLRSSKRIRIPRVKASRRLGAGVRGLRGQVADATCPALCACYGQALPVDWDPKRCGLCRVRAACYAAYETKLAKAVA